MQLRLKLARSKNTSSCLVGNLQADAAGGGGVYWIRVFPVCAPTFVFAVHSSTACSTDPHTRQSTDNAHFIHLYICYDQVPMQRTTNEHAVTVAGVGPRGQGYQGSPSHAPAYTPQPGLPGAPCVRLWVGWWCVGGEGDGARGGACAVRGARRVVWVGGARA